MSTPAPPITPPPRNPADQRLGPNRAAAVIVFFAAWIAVVGGFYLWRGMHTEKADLGTRLQNPANPKAMQDATIELAARMKNHDPEAQHWYPTLLAMTNNASAEVRGTAAWIMANDTTRDDFHQALLRLVKDPSPSVRANAAVSLARFKDPAGHQTALAMLTAPESSAEEQWEALRALRVIGIPTDLAIIAGFESSTDKRIREAAKEARRAISNK